MFRDVEVSGSNILFILFLSGGTFPAFAGPCDTLGTIPDGEGGAAAARGGGGGRAGTTCAAGARALLTDGDEDGDGGTTPKKSDCDSWMICGVEGTLRVMALLAGEGDSVGERGVLLGAFILLNKKL